MKGKSGATPLSSPMENGKIRKNMILSNLDDWGRRMMVMIFCYFSLNYRINLCPIDDSMEKTTIVVV